MTFYPEHYDKLQNLKKISISSFLKEVLINVNYALTNSI